jgi:hypothetical protein
MTGAKDRSRRWLPLLAILMVGTVVFHHLYQWPVRIQYPGDEYFGGDSIPLVELVHLRRGIPIYAPVSGDRYDAANWGPLYYLLGSKMVDPTAPGYRPLRILSMLGTLGSALGCAFLAFWYSRSYGAAVLAPLLFLSYGFVSWNGLSVRSDTVALCLCVAGSAIAYRFRFQRMMLLGVPFMLLGIYYKQQYLAGPLAAMLVLLLERRYRLAAEFAALLAIGSLGLLLYFQWGVFAGQAFLHHFVFYNILPFTARDFRAGVVYFALALLVPLLVGIRSLRVQPDKFLACYLGCTIFLGLATVGRAGSGRYYFYECALILSVLFAALAWKRITQGSNSLEFVLLLGISLFLGQLLTPASPGEEDFVRDRAVQNYLRQHFEPETLALGYYSGELMRAGLETPISNIYHYSWLVRKGLIPNQSLVDQIRNRRYGLIAYTTDLRKFQSPSLTESAQHAILANYRLEAVLELPKPAQSQPSDRFYAWVPRPSPNSTTAGSD